MQWAGSNSLRNRTKSAPNPGAYRLEIRRRKAKNTAEPQYWFIIDPITLGSTNMPACNSLRNALGGTSLN